MQRTHTGINKRKPGLTLCPCLIVICRPVVATSVTAQPAIPTMHILHFMVRAVFKLLHKMTVPMQSGNVRVDRLCTGADTLIALIAWHGFDFSLMVPCTLHELPHGYAAQRNVCRQSGTRFLCSLRRRHLAMITVSTVFKKRLHQRQCLTATAGLPVGTGRLIT